MRGDKSALNRVQLLLLFAGSNSSLLPFIIDKTCDLIYNTAIKLSGIAQAFEIGQKSLKMGDNYEAGG